MASSTPAALTPGQRLWRLLGSERRHIAYLYVYAALTGLVSLTLPLGVQSVIGFVSSGAVSTSLVVLVSFIVAGTLLVGGLQVMQVYLVEFMQQRLFARLALDFAVRLPRVRTEALGGQYLPELQNRQAQLVQARVQWQNATLQLSNYLWDAHHLPRELPADVRPQGLPSPAGWLPLPPDSLTSLAELARQLHPELQKSRAKLLQLGLERRLLSNKLLPKLTLDYNVLQAGHPFNLETGASFQGTYLQNNYKLGLSFAYPLLLRQERAKLQLNRLKLRDTELALQQDTRTIQTGVRVVANDWEALREQLALQEQVVLNAERLRQGEQTRFENGESSVFLLNAREASLVSARVKLAELRAKYAQTQATLRWAAGGVE